LSRRLLGRRLTEEEWEQLWRNFVNLTTGVATSSDHWPNRPPAKLGQARPSQLDGEHRKNIDTITTT